MFKAIETVYNNYRFRSRLEARWAVFFDTLNVEYRYESEGFDLNGIWYLPDFWLPEQEYWVEIKAIYPTAHEERKAALLAEGSHFPVYILFGTVGLPEEGNNISNGYNSVVWYHRSDFNQAVGGGTCWWCECPSCGKIGLAYKGRFMYLCSCFTPDKTKILLDNSEAWEIIATRNSSYEARRILAAYTAARQARFGRS